MQSVDLANVVSGAFPKKPFWYAFQSVSRFFQTSAFAGPSTNLPVTEASPC
jgi:hypothetical protein